MNRRMEMALGKRKSQQDELFIPTAKVVTGPGHPFYAKLNEVLFEAGFDGFLEKLCAPYYKTGGRPGIPPGVYFRMVLIGYFEGIDSQRGIAWRCADSLGLRTFLGISLTEETPVHASMTMIRQRLPESVFDKVFVFVLGLLHQKGLLRGKSVLFWNTHQRYDYMTQKKVRDADLNLLPGNCYKNPSRKKTRISIS